MAGAGGLFGATIAETDRLLGSLETVVLEATHDGSPEHDEPGQARTPSTVNLHRPN